ncbi:MAG: DUF2442 domain-containing protein [Planctomycetes bacterium]|nr:DUF2442 domain-containing protein [Planctomycetota bacterium]MBL7044508.1 DUF2442 domain-containing protein [Pirellulaceae bacterium]
MFRVVDVNPLPEFRLRLRYSDGVEGVVDLSHLVGKGVFRIWDQPGGFESVSIGSGGEIRWGDDVDICSDALYMELTGKSPDDVFPNLKRAGVNA